MKDWKIAAVAAAMLAITACNRNETTAKAAGEPAAPGVLVKAATAALRSMPVEIKTIGKVEPYASVQVKSLVGGVIRKAFFTEGDIVKKGDLLFEIDPRPYEESVRQWEANIARDKALQAQSEATLSSAPGPGTVLRYAGRPLRKIG